MSLWRRHLATIMSILAISGLAPAVAPTASAEPQGTTDYTTSIFQNPFDGGR
jgi:hypothetical protein